VPAASLLYDLVADAALHRWMSEPGIGTGAPLTGEPITFFRPLKPGVPRLREKLDALLSASRAEDQILFGVDPGSAEETLCEEVRRAFPDRDVSIVPCAPGRTLNPKISRLVQMAPQARHAAWLLSDSEVILSCDFLEALRAEWQAHPGLAALTTGYRFLHATSWPQRGDAMGVLLGLWPGAALVRRFSRINFTLGACTLFHRDSLAAVGGWEAFGEQLAEDQRLGEALVRQGGKIRLSRQVATLDSDPLSWSDYWRHQRRVSITYRTANPVGFAGVLFTFGPMWSILCLLALFEPRLLPAAIVSVLFRVWRVNRAARLLDFKIPGVFTALCVASVVEVICWLLSWFSRRVWWSGRWWDVSFRGRLSCPENPTAPHAVN
jgi:ceramide glucosyltransferase